MNTRIKSIGQNNTDSKTQRQLLVVASIHNIAIAADQCVISSSRGRYRKSNKQKNALKIHTHGRPSERWGSVPERTDLCYPKPVRVCFCLVIRQCEILCHTDKRNQKGSWLRRWASISFRRTASPVDPFLRFRVGVRWSAVRACRNTLAGRAGEFAGINSRCWGRRSNA